MSKEEKETQIPFVLITHEWLDRWLPILNETELKVYLRLAYHYNQKEKISFPRQELIAEAIGIKTHVPISNAVQSMERLGLIEINKKFNPNMSKSGWSNNTYRLLHVDSSNYHRKKQQQPSLKTAIKEFESKYEELNSIFQNFTDSKKALEQAFKSFPDFKNFYDENEFDKKEDFRLIQALPIFIISSFRNKYPIFDSLNTGELGKFIVGKMKPNDQKWEGLKNDITTKWEKLLADYDYCINYVADEHPELISVINGAGELYLNENQDWEKDIEEFTSKYPEICDIVIDYDFGVFKELAKKHNTSPWLVKDAFLKMAQENGEGFALITNTDNFVNEMILPEFETILGEDEKDLLHIYPEDIEVNNETTGKFYMESPLFNKKEKRDFVKMILKIWNIRITSIATFVDWIVKEIRKAYHEDKIIVEKYNWNNNERPVWRIKRAELFFDTYELEYSPTRMNLEELIQLFIKSFNEYTKDIREFNDVVKLGFNVYEGNFNESLKRQAPENFFFPIPEIQIEDIRELFKENMQD